MQFEGTIELPIGPDQAWTKLTDMRFLVHCLPDAEKIDNVEEDHAECVVKPGFSFVRGTLQTSIDRGELEPKSAASFRIHSKGVGSSSEVTSRLALEPSGAGTRVHWNAEVTQLGGLLKAVPKGLIRGSAQKVIEQVWENVVEKIKAEEASESA